MTQPSPYYGAIIIIAATAIIWIPLGAFFPPVLLFPVLLFVKAHLDARAIRREREAYLAYRKRTWGV